MLNDSSSIQPQSNEDGTKTKKGLFSFLYKANLTQEEFENNMNSILSINFKEKDNKSLLLLFEQKIIILMIDYSIKYNNSILVIKLLINLAQIKNGGKSNEKEMGYFIDFNEQIINCFKKLCELVDLSKKSLKIKEESGILSLSNIINNYEEILLIIFLKKLIQH